MDTESIEAKRSFLKALVKVQGTLGAVKKDSTNPHFKNKYASLESVNEAVMGPLNENGFALLQGGVDVGGKTYLRTTLLHTSGHEESFDYPLVVDSNPQHIASATTYARRYSICALLNLSLDDDDGNAASRPQPKTEPKSEDRAPEPNAEKVEWIKAKFIPRGYATKEYAGVLSHSASDGKNFYRTKKIPLGLRFKQAQENGQEVEVTYVQKDGYRAVSDVVVVANQEVPF